MNAYKFDALRPEPHKTGFMTTQNIEYLGNEGYELIGAAFEVHGELGGGMSEEIYQESFELELGFRSIDFIPKGELKLFYKGHLLEKSIIRTF
jgi:hypothetical protein